MRSINAEVANAVFNNLLYNHVCYVRQYLAAGDISKSTPIGSIQCDHIIVDVDGQYRYIRELINQNHVGWLIARFRVKRSA